MLWLILLLLACLAIVYVTSSHPHVPRIAVPPIPDPPATKDEKPMGVPGKVIDAIYSVVEGEEAVFPEATLAEIPSEEEQRYVLTTLTERMSRGTSCEVFPGQVLKARKDTSTGGRTTYTFVCLLHERTTGVSVRTSIRARVSRERPDPRCIAIRFDELEDEPGSDEPARAGDVPAADPGPYNAWH